jgi:hypothetical protein
MDAVAVVMIISSTLAPGFLSAWTALADINTRSPIKIVNV